MNEVEQAKHTPGPWTVNPIDGGPDNPTPHYQIVGRNGDEIADTYDCEVIDEANARLIAAVGELVEALKRFMGLRYHVGEPGNELGDACAFCNSMQIPHLPLSDGSPCPVELARAAIAKATGAQS